MTSPSRLQHGTFYHIYNRGTNRENLFLEPRNYWHFLELYTKHVEPVVDTFVYCLLKNHFHFLVKTKEPNTSSSTQLPGVAFSNFFNAYAKAINKAFQRTGSLFQHPFGRVHVESQRHLILLVPYIHMNPQKHGLVKHFQEWPYSSYHHYVAGYSGSQSIEAFPRGDRKLGLCREEVLGWFNGLQGFNEAHEKSVSNDADFDTVVPGDSD